MEKPMFDPRAGYPSVVPYVRYRDPAAAITWLSSVLGASEAIRMTLPDGKVGHAELVVGSHVISVGLAPTDTGGTAPVDRSTVRAMTLVFVADVDAATDTAVELGGTLVDPPTDVPWGLRQSIVADAEGQVWELSHHHHEVPLSDWGAEQTGAWIEPSPSAFAAAPQPAGDTPRAVVSCGPAMNRRTETQSIETDADPADVLAVLADPQRIPAWAPTFADTITADAQSRWRATKDDRQFNLRVVTQHHVGTVDYSGRSRPDVRTAPTSEPFPAPAAEPSS